MLYLAIDPGSHMMRYIDCAKFEDAIQEAGLERNSVDHGAFADHLGVVVSEFGMFADPNQQSYFCVFNRLYAGNALVYAFDDTGGTVDIWKLDISPIWLHGRAEVEALIRQGLVNRPELKVNDRPVWRWPDPSPFETLPDKDPS